MTVPYIFANASGALPLAELDANFANVSNSISAATGNITFNDTTISTASANSNIIIATNSSNVGSNWTFGSNGQLRIPGPITSANSITLFANTAGASNITLIANGAAGNNSFVFDSAGNLTVPGNVVANVFVGSGQYLSDLLLNPTVGNIVSAVANTNSNVANTNSNVAVNTANIVTLTAGLASTNSNVANTNSNVANLNVTVANITANIGNLQSNSYSNVNAAAYLRVYGGNIFAGNINTTGNISANTLYISQDIYAAGNLYVNNGDTIFDTTEITSNVNTLTLNHDVTTSNIADLDESGLLLGQNGLVSWTYDSQTNSWQSNVDIQPRVSNINLGNALNPWNIVYASNVIASAFNTISVVANVANLGALNVITTANIATLTVATNANIGGDLQINGNSTIINTSAISSDVPILILDKDNLSGLLANGSGIQIGEPAIATFLYNNPTTSWQSSIDITPSTNMLANLGNINNQWLAVYADNVNAIDMYANNGYAGNIFSESINGNIVYANTINGVAVSVSGTVNANIVTSISLVGLVTTPAQPRITSLGNLTVLTVVGNITGDYIYGNGRFLTGMPELYGNANVANYLPTYSGNLDTVNNITATGNITANLFTGNGSQLTNVHAVTANTVVDNAQPNITSVGNLTSLSVVGNITSGNLSANIITSVIFNAQSIVGDIIANVVISTSITGNIISGVSILGNIETAAQPNITSVGTLTSLSVSGNLLVNDITANAIVGNALTSVNLGNIDGGLVYADSTGALLNSNLVVLDVANSNVTFTANINAGAVNATGNITAGYFIGNGSQLTGLPAQYGNANVADYLPTYTGNLDNINTVTATGNITASYFIGNGSQLTGLPAQYGNANVADYLPTYTGNITATDISVNGNITANYYLGNGSQLTGMYGNADVANYIPTYNGTVGNLASTGTLSAAGNINANAMYINGNAVIVGNANVQGNLTYNNLTNLTTSNLVLGLGNNQTGVNVTGGGIVVGNTNEATILYDFSTQSWNSNINFLVAGNVSASGNVNAISFTGDGSNVSNVVALTVSQNAQANITSVGELTSLSVIGNVRSGNVFTDGRISATGNIDSAGNISADYFIGNGSELTDINATVDQLNNGSYSVELDADGVLQYASVNDQQQALTGTTTTVYGDPYTIQVNPGILNIVWTATSANVIGFKMTVRAQVGNSSAITNVEMADIACSTDGTLANTSFVISNRVKSNVSAPNMSYDVAYNGGQQLIVQVNNTNSQTAYFTHSVTEFNKT
jgi:hypothetical protein